MWQALLGALIGGTMSLIGVWLSNHLNIKERREERQGIAQEQRRAFQRTTLIDLNKALTKTMRDTAVVHLADADAAKKTGIYAGHRLPEGTEDGHLERGQDLLHLTNLVLDDDLRTKVHELRRQMHAIGLGPRTLSQGEHEFLLLMNHFESVQGEVSRSIRELWDPASHASKRPWRGRS